MTDDVLTTRRGLTGGRTESKPELAARRSPSSRPFRSSRALSLAPRSSMPPKRDRSPTGDSRSNAKLRGSLSWNKSASQPAFLKNAYAALSGQTASSSASQTGPDGKPRIPTRPDGWEEESEEDEWDFGRGDEAPAVVVLKEGRHIDREEVDRLRAQGESPARECSFDSLGSRRLLMIQRRGV